MIVRELEAGDLDGIRLVLQQARQQAHIDRGEVPKGAVGAYSDKQLVAIAGFGFLDDGLAAWVLFTDAFKPHHMMEAFDAMRGTLNVWRKEGIKIYIRIEPSVPESLRLARLLGFAFVGHDVVDGRPMERMIYDRR